MRGGRLEYSILWYSIVGRVGRVSPGLCIRMALGSSGMHVVSEDVGFELNI